MKKETIAAVIFGIVLGGILAVFLIIKNKEKQLETNKSIKPQEKSLKAQASSPANFKQLEINEPADKSIVNKNSITIKGIFAKDSLIIIQSPIKETVLKNTQEQFSVDFPLALGENVIRLSLYPQDKQLKSQEKELHIYYFQEQL